MKEPQREDYRFPSFIVDEETTKGNIIIHMYYAHDEQAREQGIQWGGSNFNYWRRKYDKAELLEIHGKYHKGDEK